MKGSGFIYQPAHIFTFIMKLVPSAVAKRGFTLIELLVVIAIIGILSSVVLASLNTARAKGTDAKIQSEIRSIAVNAEIYYDNTSNTYGTDATSCQAGMYLSTSPNIAQIIQDLIGATGPGSDPACRASSNTWAVQHMMTSNTQGFCVDSTGRVSTSTTPLATAANSLCPTS